MTANALQIEGLTASLGEHRILKGIDLTVPFGEIHALMGPNGSGKSTLAHVLTGHEDYQTEGSALVNGVDIIGLSVHERARAGLFQAFQYPVALPGISLQELSNEMEDASDDPDVEARAHGAAERMRMEPFLSRFVNVGLSGGEKKRSEMYQLAVASPTVAILDEIDSGLDVDAVRDVAEMVESLRDRERGVLVITHYSRILRYMTVDRIHVLVDGRIVESGGSEVAERLEAEGYKPQ
ncbi:MAG: Fe-S cluster assembly ATPase SufC [Acidimicrobiia bacterium]|nr:MAG: Fe-S cluster assembly ATPase SufC [Acidimicrobiia bacterium]